MKTRVIETNRPLKQVLSAVLIGGMIVLVAIMVIGFSEHIDKFFYNIFKTWIKLSY